MAGRALANHVTASAKDPELLAAAKALAENRLPVAERSLKDYLARHPTDVAAIRMLAELAARLGRYGDAETLLVRAIELAPHFRAARHNLAIIELRMGKVVEAAAETETLLREAPKDPAYLTLRCAALVRLGDYERGISQYEALLKDYPRQAKTWMSYGHALKTVGRQADAVDAYRKSIALLPSLGEAYWSLANLKTVRFSDSDVEQMRRELQRDDLNEDDRLHLHFALGKALEDAGCFEESFRHYDDGNALRQRQIPYSEDQVAARFAASASLFTRTFLDSRRGQGCPATDPIFVVGLPRAGSTLIEQILSSHSMIEGTMELPDMTAIARRLAARAKEADSAYPDLLAALPPDELRALGEDYLTTTRVQRRTDKPYFIDKMPNNFAHIGLIRLILPNAKIIDARRHPMACCFSNFKQHFAKGQAFTYGQERVARYYREYVLLMKAFDAAAPGAVHRVIHERLVDNLEAEICALLAYVGVPFEPACLRFYETERPVRTASSEQVRRPIFTEGLDQWRNYEPWLGPMKAALGEVLDAYPDPP
jgi:tetratricopeptide (TPR) repeat protein